MEGDVFAAMPLLLDSDRAENSSSFINYLEWLNIIITITIKRGMPYFFDELSYFDTIYI